MKRYIKESLLEFRCPYNLGTHQPSLIKGEMCKIDFIETLPDGSDCYVVHSLERKGIAETLYFDAPMEAYERGWPV